LGLPYLANSTGWILTEMGRMPWVVYGVMRVEAGISRVVGPGQVWQELYPSDKKFSPGSSRVQMAGSSEVIPTEASSGVDPRDLKIRWRATRDGTYYLYVNGREISRETNFELKGEDLYVFHPRTGRTFLLKNFVNRCDNVTRRGILVHNKR